MTFEEAMAAGSRLFDVRATITCVDTTVINATGNHIMGFSVDDGGQMPLGTAVSARYTLELSNADGEWLRNGSMLGNRSLTGARVKVEMAVHHDGAWDWQSVGVFIVDRTSAREQDTRMRLIGNDPLAALDVLFDDSLVYRSTTTLNDILTHIRSKGVTINGTLATNGGGIVNYTPDWGDDATIREVLCYVAQLGGCFVRCDREGVVELVPLNGSTTHAITTSTYLNFTDDERYFNFNRIKVQPLGAKKDKTYVESAVNAVIPESAANTLVIENNPLFKTKTTYSYYKASTWREGRQYYTRSGGKYTAVSKDIADESSLGLYYQRSTNYNTTNLQTMVTNLKTALTGVAFRAIDFTWLGNPAVRVGDKAALTDTRGVTTTAIIVQQRLSFEDGTFRAQVSCPLDLEAVTPASITPSGRVLPPSFGVGTIDGSVIIPGTIPGDLLVNGAVTADKIAAKSVTADEIAAKTITADEIKAGTITADEVAAKTITADEIAAGTITATEIGASQITATHIGTNEIVANAANIKDGVITNAKIANGTIENAKIKDATIETAKIKDAAITTAKIQDAQITNAKIAAAGIDFANIKDVVAGTGIFRQGVGDALYLDRLVVNDANFASAIAGKLMIRDTDGKLYRISVNSSGAVTATQVQVNGDSLTDNAVMSVSQRLLWRQATQPSAPWVGMLWLDTTTEKLKRCTAITPSVAWEVVPAGEVHTAVIDVDDTGMNILSGGNLNLLSGGAINIKNLGDTGNVINMDNTGLTLSSTGQLKLTSADSIVIGGSPFSVGGTNFYSKSTAYTTYTDAGTLNVNGRDQAGYENGFYVTGPDGSTNNYLRLNGVITEKGYWTVSFDVRGTQGVVVPVTVDICDLGTRTYYTNATNTYERKSLTVNVTNSYDFVDIGKFGYANYLIRNIKVEKGTVATDWSPAPSDPATGVKTSKIEIGLDFINVDSGGTLTLHAADDIKIGAGSDTLVTFTDAAIDAKADTIDLSANNSLKLAVGGIQVGGRNLLRNTLYTNGTPEWSIGSNNGLSKIGTHTPDPFGGIAIRFYDIGGLTWAYNDSIKNLPLSAGDKLTLSFWAFGTNNHGGFSLTSGVPIATIGTFGLMTPKKTVGGWSYYEATCTLTSGGTAGTHNLEFGTTYGPHYFCRMMLEEGNKATSWSPAPSDPASGVKTSFIDIATDHIDISSGGNINLSAGAKLSATAGTIQLEAASASGSVLQFGDALNISEGSSGYQLSINSATNDAIRVNNNPVWHKGNIVVQQAQPASGNGVIWVKPLAGTATVNYIAALSTKLEYAGGGTRTWTLSNTTGDTMSAAGTYTFTVTFKLQRTTINQRTPYINTTGGSVVLTKGAGSLTIALPALQFGPWWQRTVSVTGTTTSTAFTSGTGTISAAITLTGTPAYGGDDFIHHVKPSDITCKIDGPGASGTAQSVEIKFVP